MSKTQNVTVRLDDLKIEALRTVAEREGIDHAELDRDTLLSKIKAQCGEMAFSTGGENQKGMKEANPKKAEVAWIALALSFLSAIGAGIAAWAAWHQATATVGLLQAELTKANKLDKELIAEERQRKVMDWQKGIVFNIIRKGTDTDGKGISFDEIKSKYLEEAGIVKGIDLQKEELQPVVLRQILMNLMTSGLIYHTLNDKYTVQLSLIDPKFSRVFIEKRAKYAIVNLLAIDGGRYTVQQIAQKITQQFNLTNEEFIVVIVDLITANAVIIDKNQNVWSAANPPPKP